MKRGGLAERILLAVSPWLTATLIRLLARCMRLEIVGEEHPRRFWASGEHLLFALWHDQLLLMVKGYRGPGARILISASRDGELIARTVARFGHQAVRGSSHRHGREAFQELVEMAAQPWDIGITPDGPRGPRHELKYGIVRLAQLSGRAVIPIAFACSRGHRFASWDRFLLPYPFARGVFVYGEPLRSAAGEEIETFRQRLAAAMTDTEQRAIAHLERYGVSAV